MFSSHRIELSLLFAGACVLIGIVCLAGPNFPRDRLSNEIRTLAGVKNIEVIIETKSKDLFEVKYLPHNAKKVVEQMLSKAGIESVDGTGGPVLRIAVITGKNPQFPDFISFTYHLSFEQLVRVDRLDAVVHVLTYALVYGSFTKKDLVLRDLNKTLPTLTKHFIERVKLANKAS